VDATRPETSRQSRDGTLHACATRGERCRQPTLPAAGTRRWRASSGRSRSAPTKACMSGVAAGALAERMTSQHQSTRPGADRSAGVWPMRRMRFGLRNHDRLPWSRTCFRWRRRCAGANRRAFVDLDGPRWMAKAATAALRYEGSLVYPPEADYGADAVDSIFDGLAVRASHITIQRRQAPSPPSRNKRVCP